MQAFGIKHPVWLERSGNVQFLPAPNDTPLWLSHIAPRSTPDITAARRQAHPRSKKNSRRKNANSGGQGLYRYGHRYPDPAHRSKSQSNSS